MISFKFWISLLNSTRKTSLFNIYPFLYLDRNVSNYLGDWKCPKGHETGIHVYNSLVYKKVPLLLKRKDIAMWYMCGPTVYDESHIGHASCYVKFDIIRRIMENIFNINIVTLMGITDIDDKIIKKANQMGCDISQISNKYLLEFFSEMKTLRVQSPTLTSKVTENIPLIISYCKKLIDKGYAYATSEGNVYFIVKRSASADVSHNILEETQAISDPLKKDPRDFVLWKKAKAGEPYWSSPWGNGRPGWHIECSVMASTFFGSEVDIHSGGLDLIFPHHTNEKSQSEAYFGCNQWVNYWLHAGLLQVQDDIKMSKSLGNTITIKEFLKENSVNEFRILCLQSLYRNNISFSVKILDGAKGLNKKFHNFLNEAEAFINGETKYFVLDGDYLLTQLISTKDKVLSAFANDFNTSQALLCLNDLIDEVNKSLHANNEAIPDPLSLTAMVACSTYLDKMLEILGINILTKKKLPKDFILAVNAFVNFRNKIRVYVLKNKADEKLVLVPYLDKITKDLNKDLYFYGFHFEINAFNKLSKIYMPKPPEWSSNLYENFLNISEAIIIFYKEVLNVAEALQKFEEGINIKPDTDEENNKCRKKKNERIVPILKSCDKLRSAFETFGIGIKDKSIDSSWLPLSEKGLEEKF